MDRRIPTPGFEPTSPESHKRVIEQMQLQEDLNRELDVRDTEGRAFEDDDLDLPAPKLSSPEAMLAKEELAQALNDDEIVDQAFKEISNLGEDNNLAA